MRGALSAIALTRGAWRRRVLFSRSQPLPHAAPDGTIRAMEQPRLTVSKRLRELLSYAKFAGTAPRVLILRSEYWIDGACVHACRDLGWEVKTVPTVLEGTLPRESVARLLETLAEFRPDFVLTVNLSGMDVSGLFARFFEDVRIPYVTWFVDDPRTILMDRTDFASPYAVALTWEGAYTASHEAAGFPVVATVPLAADPHVFNRAPADTWDFPPSFVGNSMVSFAQRQWERLRAMPDLAAAVKRSFDEGRVTRGNFGRGLCALLDAACVNTLSAEQRRHAEMTFFVEGTRRLRHALASATVPEGAVMRGDDDWRTAFPSSGGALPYMEELPAFYGSCEVNLNSTSIQMATTVNQRVFDCPAAGGFLLTDSQPALDELFDVERECVVYRSLDECMELLRFFRAHPAARREIAVRARTRVLGEHTYAHRVQHIAGMVKERFA